MTNLGEWLNQHPGGLGMLLSLGYVVPLLVYAFLANRDLVNREVDPKTSESGLWPILLFGPFGLFWWLAMRQTQRASQPISDSEAGAEEPVSELPDCVAAPTPDARAASRRAMPASVSRVAAHKGGHGPGYRRRLRRRRSLRI